MSTTYYCEHCGQPVRVAVGHWQVVAERTSRDYHEQPGCTEAARDDAKQHGVELWHTLRNSVSQMFSV